MLTGRLLRVLRECENVGKKVLTLFCLSFIVFFSIFGGAIEAVFNSCSRFSSYISSPCIFMAITSEFHCITAFFFFLFSKQFTSQSKHFTTHFKHFLPRTEDIWDHSQSRGHTSEEKNK